MGKLYTLSLNTTPKQLNFRSYMGLGLGVTDMDRSQYLAYLYSVSKKVDNASESAPTVDGMKEKSRKSVSVIEKLGVLFWHNTLFTCIAHKCLLLVKPVYKFNGRCNRRSYNYESRKLNCG